MEKSLKWQQINLKKDTHRNFKIFCVINDISMTSALDGLISELLKDEKLLERIKRNGK